MIFTLIKKPLVNGHPLLRGHLERSQGCPLNRGFTVFPIHSAGGQGGRNPGVIGQEVYRKREKRGQETGYPRGQESG